MRATWFVLPYLTSANGSSRHPLCYRRKGQTAEIYTYVPCCSIDAAEQGDLRSYLQFDLERCLKAALEISPTLKILQVSATTGEGMESGG